MKLQYVAFWLNFCVVAGSALSLSHHPVQVLALLVGVIVMIRTSPDQTDSGL